MRNTFAKTLFGEMKKNKRIILLTGDLGYSVFEDIIKECPEQYINCGLTEQSMTGIASGLASEGYIPIIYSIIPFITMRNFEQIRNDICYQNLPVMIVGVGAGFSYGPYGHTHHALEDISIMRTLPHMTILSPGDPYEVEQFVPQIIRYKRPVYMRLGKTGEEILHKPTDTIKIGTMSMIKKGKDMTLFSTSSFVASVMKTASLLHTQGISASVVSVSTIKPLDGAFIRKCAKIPFMVSMEEHSLIGGLGGAIAEYVCDELPHVRLLRLGVQDRFTPIQGMQEDMRKANELTPQQMAVAIKKFFHTTLRK